MAIFESQAMLWEIGFLLMALIYPIWFILLIVKADKDKQVEFNDLLRQEADQGV
ncbi:hypothetical protein [Candidatus Acidianus copahuensis]|uniref:hypothetical protein n=1 Tax=Candidatus Acidianus copahuensis TaxID=1160895 RepID=UPI00135F1928|nr:hypothetical protein [Candidatus Acidianus copahuensis]